MPAFRGGTVFRRDLNIRANSILGFAGSGGIGVKLQRSRKMLAWPPATVIVILATLVPSEWVPARMRHAIIRRPAPDALRFR